MGVSAPAVARRDKPDLRWCCQPMGRVFLAERPNDLSAKRAHTVPNGSLTKAFLWTITDLCDQEVPDPDGSILREGQDGC
jgi:hypothetical protein